MLVRQRLLQVMHQDRLVQRRLVAWFLRRYADVRGASLITLAKGNRAKNVREACGKFGGFYLGTIGGAAARLAKDSIRKVEVIDFKELGMEAVFKIESRTSLRL